MNNSQQEKAKRLIAMKQGKSLPGEETTGKRHTQKSPTTSFAKTTATKKYVKKRPH
ncbi:hypothetical protein [Vagococcus fessus]|uniref:hypothetical protein n=1 Tax=Vagococcus fessus TaxID=120370 RepID=UPI001474114B|nr:hypothetical protein [Vagococcus fessus]